MDIRLGKGIEKVIVLDKDASGKSRAKTVYRKDYRKRKSSIGPLEKAVRASSRGLSTLGDTYRELHDKSNAKKPDGWLRDLPYNVYKAFGKAAGKYQVLPIFFPFAVLENEDDDDEDDDED